MMPTLHREEVFIGANALAGELIVPMDAVALVLFVHGSGSSRFSPRNRCVASVLHEHGMATLLFDLLTDAQSHDRDAVFNINLLASRVESALDRAAECDDISQRTQQPSLQQAPRDRDLCRPLA